MRDRRPIPLDLALMGPVHAALRSLEDAVSAASVAHIEDFAATRQGIDLSICIANLRDQMRRYRRSVTRPPPRTRRRPPPRCIGDDDWPF